MDIAALSTWLKNTIPGIIVLGAIGSIAAAFLLWLVRKAVVPVINQSAKAAVKRIAKHFFLPAAKQLVRLHFVQGSNKVHVFYTLQVMKVTFSLFLATCSFVLFAIAVSTDDPILFRPGVLLPLVVLFWSMWYALRCLAVAMIPLYVDIDKLISETKDEVLKKAEKVGGSTGLANKTMEPTR